MNSSKSQNQDEIEGSEKGFSKLRSFLWPIHRYELKRFLPMMLLFFLISFNYHLLRIAKDALIITAPQSGAEAIPFLKVWAMLPTAVIMTLLYTKLSNIFNREKIFYVMMTIFLGFFSFFILVLYPLRETLYLDSFANYLQGILPSGLGGMIAIIRYWMYTLFYVAAESWSNIILSVLLWGLANDITSVGEAKRFYALFGIGVNSAGILAGEAGSLISVSLKNSANSATSWDDTVMVFVVAIILVGITAVSLYRWMHVYVFTEVGDVFESIDRQKKPKETLLKSFSVVFRSKYLLCIAVIVLSYNLVINLTEVLWKSQMKALFPQPGEYTAYMSDVTFYIGIIATISSYFISGNVIRRCGWRFAALATPVIIVVTGVGFFYFMFLQRYSTEANSAVMILGMTPLALSVFFGSAQNICSRAAKYTVFDDTKEMAFIPLAADEKLKGKAAIDGIGSRLGKSGSSLMIQIMLMFFASPIACAPIIASMVFLIIPMWVTSIFSLSKQFDAKNS